MTAPVCDVHTHLAPRLDDESATGHPGLYDAGRLSAWAVDRGLDLAWVSAPPPFYRQHLSVADCGAWVRRLNQGMARRVEGIDHLRLLEHLPLEHTSVCLELVEAGPTSSATVGWSAPAGGSSTPLDDPALEPVWDRLAALGMPVVLHPGESPDQRLDAYYLTNLLGNPVETAVAFGQLLFGGVLDRHPSLHVVLVHGGGVLPAVLGRWARGVSTLRPGVPADVDPLASSRRVWVDSLAHDPRLVDLAVDVFGVDRVVLGSDYPFPMGVDDPFESIAHLDPDLRGRIAANAADLLRVAP